jgi:hypothetical protein
MIKTTAGNSTTSRGVSSILTKYTGNANSHTETIDIHNASGARWYIERTTPISRNTASRRSTAKRVCSIGRYKKIIAI